MCNKHSNSKSKLDEKINSNKAKKSEAKKSCSTMYKAIYRSGRIWEHKRCTKRRECETTDGINDDDIPNSVTIRTQIASLIHLLFTLFVPPCVRYIHLFRIAIFKIACVAVARKFNTIHTQRISLNIYDDESPTGTVYYGPQTLLLLIINNIMCCSKFRRSFVFFFFFFLIITYETPFCISNV